MRRTIGRDLNAYYRLHAPIYDLTRPFFLFGRGRLIAELATRCQDPSRPPPRILEVGCGTGRNLASLRQAFPLSRLVGIDLSEAMLKRARRRLGCKAELIHGALGVVNPGAPFDIVIASYMLSMTGDEQARCIAAMRAVLAPGGCIGVVDFHSSPSGAFQNWMQRNHVRFDDGLPARLAVAPPGVAPEQASFATHAAYGGCWRYFTWVGH